MKLWRIGKVIPEKMTTSMSHQPCHFLQDNRGNDGESDPLNGSDEDSEEESEDEE